MSMFFRRPEAAWVEAGELRYSQLESEIAELRRQADGLYAASDLVPQNDANTAFLELAWALEEQRDACLTELCQLDDELPLASAAA